MSRRPFGSARLRASGRWEARYIVDGQQHRAPDTFASKTEATLYLDSMRVQITKGTWLDPRVSGETLESYARAWIAQRQGLRGRPLAVRTRETYTSSLNLHIGPRIGHLPLSKGDPGHRPYLAQRQGGDRQANGCPAGVRPVAGCDDNCRR